MNKRNLPEDDKTGLKPNYDNQIIKNTKGNLTIWLDSNIDTKNSPEKSRTVTIDSKEYIIPVSQIFVTDKNFKGSDDISNTNMAVFEKVQERNWTKNSDYITWQDIVDSDIMENLQFNWKIIQKIVHWDLYKWSWFEFLKDSGLVKLNWENIDKMELEFYRNSNGPVFDTWGDCVSIWLHAIEHFTNQPACIKFKENGAYISSFYPSVHMRIASQK